VEREAALAKHRAEEKARLAAEKARLVAEKGKKRQAGETPALERPEKKMKGEGPCARCKATGAECVLQTRK
jgi:hypothetical protein